MFLHFDSLRRGAASLLVVALFGLCSAQAQIAPSQGPKGPGGFRRVLEDFDLRTAEPATAAVPSAARAAYRSRALNRTRAAAVEALTTRMAEGRASLAARIPTLQVELNLAGRVPEIIGTATASQFLTGPGAERENTARDFLRQEAAVYGLTAEEIAGLVKIADYANPAGNMAWVEFRQDVLGLPVFQGELRAGFTPRGELARTTGNLVPGLDPAALSAKPGLSVAEGVAKAAAAIQVSADPARLTVRWTEENGRRSILTGGPFDGDTRAELIWFPVEPGVAVLAWSVTLWRPIYSYAVLVDANDGTLLWRKNITQHQTQPATYSVYTGASPAPASPTPAVPGTGSGYQAPGVARSTVTLIGNEPPNTFNNLGWLTDGATVTTGNNVNAGLDIVSPNGIDAGGQASSATRNFVFEYNPPPLGTDLPSTANSRSGAVTNLFYWTNVYHDRLYLLGFTEPARNFQTNNFGRGGSGNDAVLAEVQDYSGTNNANFSTPADGSAGRMQMYLFTGPQRDGSLDGEVFIHELTHGTSNRLHANGSGLSTTQSGGMGEGWSDFYARALLSNATENVDGVFASGSYVTLQLSGTFTDNYYYGIRIFPYAVYSNTGPNGKPHNPLTFGALDLAQINGHSNGAYPSNPVIRISANEVHNIGVFWCTALLEMRARMIRRLGYAVGNQRALQIVTDAMKLDPTGPTIVQARDAIIAADNAAYAGDDVADIRSAFAIRGVGAGASTTGSTYFTIVESFYPSSVVGAVTVTDPLGNGNGVPEPGEDLVLTVPLTNRLSFADTGVTFTVGGGSPVNYASIAAGATVSASFPYHVPDFVAPGTLLQVPVVVSSQNGNAYRTIPLRVGTPVTTVAFSENFNAAAVGSLPAGWTQTGTAAGSTWAVSATVIDGANCVTAADPTVASDSSLVSPVFALPAGNAYQLSFRHRFTTEASYDGGALEISVAGGAFADIITAGGTWVQGGYGYGIRSDATGNPLAGRRAWAGTLTTTTPVVVNLPASAAGQNVQLRWRFGADSGGGAAGWLVDSIQVYSTAYTVATLDTDGDGMIDGQETFVGTAPNSATSVFRPVPAYPASGAPSLTFQSVLGRTYTLEAKDDLTPDSSWSAVQGAISGTGGEITITDPFAKGVEQRFYRIRVRQP